MTLNRFYYSRPEWIWEYCHGKGYSTFPNALGLEPHNQMQFCFHCQDTSSNWSKVLTSTTSQGQSELRSNCNEKILEFSKVPKLNPIYIYRSKNICPILLITYNSLSFFFLHYFHLKLIKLSFLMIHYFSSLWMDLISPGTYVFLVMFYSFPFFLSFFLSFPFLIFLLCLCFSFRLF